jgi:inorganic pyrophosphatase
MLPSVDLAHLDPVDPESGAVRAIIETPAGSRHKLKYDEELGLFTIDRVLPRGAEFPYDFGFIPSTRGEDGDPIDVLVLLEAPSYPGCALPVRLIGVVEAEQSEDGEKVRNDRLLAVLDAPKSPAKIHSLDDLPAGQLDEIEHFFVSFNRWAGREYRSLGRHGPDRARALLEQARSTEEKNARRSPAARPPDSLYRQQLARRRSNHVVSARGRRIGGQGSTPGAGKPAEEGAGSSGR